MKQFRNLTGQRFGRWQVIAFAGRLADGQPYWRCRCDCGNEKVIWKNNLTRLNPPHSRSCGCLRRDQMRVKMQLAHQIIGDAVKAVQSG